MGSKPKNLEVLHLTKRMALQKTPVQP